MARNICHFFTAAKFGRFQVHKVLALLAEKYGPIFKQTMRKDQVVYLSDADDIQKAFAAEGKYPMRRSFGINDVYKRRRNKPQAIGSAYVCSL